MSIKLKTSKETVPTIYSYSTPEIARHDGWTKIGYTEQEVGKRLDQQLHTADVEYKLEWSGNAVFENSSDTFTDKMFHAYLRKNGVEEMEGKNNEWFHIDGPTGRNHFYAFRENKGIMSAIDTVIPYNLRNEQSKAVAQAKNYHDSTENGEFLWNCKPRFGKTLSVYDFCKKVDAQTVLIVTNRPAIANSWYEDYCKFLGDESGYKFISTTDSLKGKPYVLNREEYFEACKDGKFYKQIEFVSLQDLKGSIYFGGKFNKLEHIKNLTWDVLVIDEAHEGVDTYKTDVAFDRIKRKFTLHLSGTPFKALANEKFKDEAIFNWTYADEQQAKRDWKEEDGSNPYATLPQLAMYTYQMSEIIKDELDQGIEINGETEEYAFDLNEFFAVNATGAFIHNSSVDKFLDAMVTQTKFPFSTEELRDEIKHSFWLLNRVDSAKALAAKLKKHPVFKEYEVVLAAGDGKLDDADETAKSFDKVRKAIKKGGKTITLSVGQLTTGVTIPEWTAVMMLSNVKSPSLYMQAAFRAQNPHMFNENGKHYRKETAYVFDFDPARTLTIFEEFANDLSANTVNGKGDTETRKKNVKTLLNFFPVIGEDENGEMMELDAEQVLVIPRKIKSVEVVKRGFMSNYLFQNVSNVFGAPKEVLEIIGNLPAQPEPKVGINDQKTREDLCLDEDGEVVVPDEMVIGTADEFGDKIYEIEDVEEIVTDVITHADEGPSIFDTFKDKIKSDAVDSIINSAEKHYGNEVTNSDKKQITRHINSTVETKVEKIRANYDIDINELTTARDDAILRLAETDKTRTEIYEEYNAKVKEVKDKLKETLSNAVNDIVEEVSKEAVKTVETNKRIREKNSIEEGIRDHLRGFSRTIPSFLMAYGDDTVTLATFDSTVPDNVFLEVTSITLDQFKFLRDGGKYIDEETGEEKMFNGNLFDPIVFDDSVKEFLSLRKKLADYFDDKAIEDIFDYIPPQKTNQIFTPKIMVKKMVDMLEEENPGCFDNPDKTFIDLYMKSGLYITEIVKKLYNSDGLKAQFPNGEERLQHIFEKQVYGLAPTEIIYKIATNFILGFDEDVKIKKHNFRQADALPYTKEGTLNELLDELYDEEV